MCHQLLYFCKPKQGEAQADSLSVGVGTFTGLLWDFLCVLWCWEADALNSAVAQLRGRDELQPNE